MDERREKKEKKKKSNTADVSAIPVAVNLAAG